MAVILSVLLAVGAAYAGLSHSLARLAERLARVEGIIEGWLNPPPPRDPKPPSERRAAGVARRLRCRSRGRMRWGRPDRPDPPRIEHGNGC